MNAEKPYQSTDLEDSIGIIQALVWQTAQAAQGNNLELLALLRSLEALHRKIRQDLFEPSLPHTRNDLYHLVREVEESGGWPYIERMRLQSLLQNLVSEPIEMETEPSIDPNLSL